MDTISSFLQFLDASDKYHLAEKLIGTSETCNRYYDENTCKANSDCSWGEEDGVFSCTVDNGTMLISLLGFVYEHPESDMDMWLGQNKACKELNLPCDSHDAAFLANPTTTQPPALPCKEDDGRCESREMFYAMGMTEASDPELADAYRAKAFCEVAKTNTTCPMVSSFCTWNPPHECSFDSSKVRAAAALNPTGSLADWITAEDACPSHKDEAACTNSQQCQWPDDPSSPKECGDFQVCSV